jgi:D-lyxose ketol-isomerase
MDCKYTYNGVEYSKEQLVSKLSNENSNFQTLYNNLVNEITNTETGRKILDRTKRDYIRKIPLREKPNRSDGRYSPDENVTFPKYNSREDYEDDLFFWEQEKDDISNNYTLEEQQEEAIVELLGLMTAEKLDKVKDGKLISLLKRLLKEMKAFIRSLIGQKEVEIDKLPDNMTLGDLSDLLAYSNSKLILPGYEVEYTTPDNEKFKTYQEASNHISELAKSAEDVDLDNINLKSIDTPIYITDITQIPLNITTFSEHLMGGFPETFYKENNKWMVKSLEYGKEEIYEPRPESVVASFNRQKISKPSLKLFIQKNKEYEQSKEIIEEWKKVNNIQYNPEEIYSRGQEFVSVVGAYSNFDVNLMMQNLLQHIEDNEKAGGKFAISAFTKPIDKVIGHLEGGGGKIKFKLYPQSQDILWAANTDVYSGSVWDASEKVNKDKKSELLGV